MSYTDMDQWQKFYKNVSWLGSFQLILGHLQLFRGIWAHLDLF